jgi:hypothetical protein
MVWIEQYGPATNGKVLSYAYDKTGQLLSQDSTEDQPFCSTSPSVWDLPLNKLVPLPVLYGCCSTNKLLD